MNNQKRIMSFLYHASILLLLMFLDITLVSCSSGLDEKYNLIVKDFKRTTSSHDINIAKDASFDCWVDALNSLETQTFSNDETLQYYEQLNMSPGGNFCALLKSGYGSLDALAFLLTKCEYEKFSEPLPEQCTLNVRGRRSMNIDAELRDCMQSLPNETWLGVWTAFTQYKLSSYNICMKLTDELMLRRQKEAALHLERTMVGMEGKIDEVLMKADLQIEESIVSMSSKIEEMKRDVKDDMKDMMNSEMRQVQHIHEEIRDVLNKADDKFDETTRKMESYIQTKVSELFQKIGLDKVVGVASQVKNLSNAYTECWSFVKILFRSLVILLFALFLTRAERMKSVRFVMILLASLELCLDIFLRCFGELLNIGKMQRNVLRSFLRFGSYFMNMIVVISTLFRKKQDETKKTDPAEATKLNAFSSALENVKTQIETDRKERRREYDDHWKQIALMSLQQQDRNHIFGSDHIAMTPQHYSTPLLRTQLYASPTTNSYSHTFITPRSDGMNEMKQRLDVAFAQERNSTYQYDVIGGLGKQQSFNSTIFSEDSSLAYETASEGVGRHSVDSSAAHSENESNELEVHRESTKELLLSSQNEGKLLRKRKGLEKDDHSEMDQNETETYRSPQKKHRQS